MTKYAYKCSYCGMEQDFNFPMGEAPHEFGVTERVVHWFIRVITVPIIQGDTVAGGVPGGSKDGYVLDSKTGWTSRKGLQLDEKDRKSRAPK